MSLRDQRERALQRYSSLIAQRTSWMQTWQEVGRFILPRAGRFYDEVGSSPNRGDRKNQHILDSTATRASGILTAGLLSGASSPARPWFRLRTPDADLNKREAVKEWLWVCEERMRDVFNQSNTYRAFRSVYQELGVFGTGANILLPNYDRVINNTPLTAGEYALDVDDEGRVNTLYRKISLTVGSVVQRFGYKACSTRVRNMYDRGNLSAWVDVLHVIEPRRERNPMKLDAANMPYASCYYEWGAQGEDVLRISGHRELPGQVPRWEVRGANTYGESPGTEVLGDVKQLQHQQLRKGQAIDFQTMPPLRAGSAHRANGGLNMTPGAVTWIDEAKGGVGPLFEARLELSALLNDIQDVRGRIERGFYVDLFLMILSDPRGTPPTAREVAERHEEKLIMLGPVLESLHDEFLGPYVEQSFSYMLEAGLIPPPPEELEGVPLNIKFVSLLAQAQNMVGITGVERLVGSVANLVGVKPDIIDKLDTDRAVEVYADMLGVDPTLVVASDRVALIREQRAQQQQQAQAMAAAQQGAQVARDLGQAGEQGMDAAAQAAAQLGIV